jgi:hypothetical protein
MEGLSKRVLAEGVAPEGKPEGRPIQEGMHRV